MSSGRQPVAAGFQPADSESAGYKPAVTGDGVRFYTAVCGVALVLIALPLLARGMGLWCLFPSAVGALALAARWRMGPALLLIALFWLVLADRMGYSAWTMLEWVGAAVSSSIFRVPSRPPLRDFFFRHLQNASLLFDVLLAAAVVAYTAGQYRLVSLTGNILPVERRRRPEPSRERKGGKLPLQRVPPHKRGGHLVEAEEVGPLIFAAVMCACFGQFLWLWLGERYAGGDLYEYARVQLGIDIPDGAWRLFVLVWVFALVLIPVTGVLAYLGQRRMTPEESALYLQDQLWRQTRREQARIGRWLAWALRRRRLRRENRKEKP
jgi:hypothetical protein